MNNLISVPDPILVSGLTVAFAEEISEDDSFLISWVKCHFIERGKDAGHEGGMYLKG